MAIIHTTPRHSGTETLLKLLDTLTDEIVLSPGKILMGQFYHDGRIALKLSLYVNEDASERVGIRNVFIEDVRDMVLLRVGDKKETKHALKILGQTQSWEQAFPPQQCSVYCLTELERAAQDVRDFLLFGKRPGTPLKSDLLDLITVTSPSQGYVTFNVLTTLPEYE